MEELSFDVIGRPVDVDGGGAPLFVLVHGIGASHRYSAPLHAVLEQSDRVLAVDLPGFGGVPRPSGDLGVADMAAALGILLESLTSGPALLIGHSMGAQWVVETALQRPDLVAAVVTIGAVVDDEHRTAGAQALALALDSLGEPPMVNAILVADYLRCGVPWYLTQLRHMLAYPTEERVRELTVPLLVARGGNDPVAGRAWCRRLRDAAPQSTLVEVPGRRHVVQYSAPRAVASAIRTHLMPNAVTEVAAE